MMDVKKETERVNHAGKRAGGQTERWKDRLDTENPIDRERGGNRKWWRPSSITACLCLGWCGSGKGRRGGRSGRFCEINMQ